MLRRMVRAAGVFVLLVCQSLACGQVALPAKENTPRTDVNSQAILKIGDPAPPLVVERWFRGEPVAAFRPGHVYVLDFWAIWCGPCIAGMPRLTELQARHKDSLTVIGLCAEDKWGGTVEAIEKFIAKRPERTGYSFALDPPANTEHEAFKGVNLAAYLLAADLKSLPSAFIIDQHSRVAFIGLPSEMDATLEAVLAGTFDMPAAAEAYQVRLNGRTRLKEFQLLIRDAKYDAAYLLGEALVHGELANDSWGLLVLAEESLSDKIAVENRRPSLARKAMERSRDLNQSRDPSALSLLAKACWMMGDQEEAVRVQRAAIALAEGGQREALEQALAGYTDPKK